MSDIPILGRKADTESTVEVCRSFSYKLNLANHGGPQYESADFFASRKLQARSEDSHWVSEQIFEECVAEVRSSVTRFIAEMQRKVQQQREERQTQRRTA